MEVINGVDMNVSNKSTKVRQSQRSLKKVVIEDAKEDWFVQGLI